VSQKIDNTYVIHPILATLVALTGEFGVSDASARAALSQLAHRRLLSVSRSGRNTLYSATPLAERMPAA
jgi:DNA-binding transcriptional regulator PaaX